MLSNSLSTSAKVAALYRVCPKMAEFCRTLFPLLVAHSDDWGRLPGDEETVKLKVDPISPRKLSDFVAALHLMHEVGLITWYQVEDRKVIEIIKFGEHQDLKGHLDDPKRKPKLPACPNPSHLIGRNRRDEETRLNLNGGLLGEFGEIAGPKGTEGKGREEKGTEENVGGAGKAPTPTHDFLGWFVNEYKRQRHGATYRITDKHGGIVKGLLKTHSPERLRHLTAVLFGSNDEWIESTDRGIEVMAGKINWLEERLCAWEAKKRANG